MKKLRQYGTFAAVLMVCAFTVAGCGKKDNGGAPAFGGMTVNVVAFESRVQSIEDKISLVGTLQANEAVEIKSEIDGTVEEIAFEEGEHVKKDDILFRVDEKKLQAVLDQSRANLNLAETTSKRYETLVQSNAVSKQEYDQAMAELESRRAGLTLMQEQLSDATISAPFDGVLGERLISVGQFISKGTPLTWLVSQDPMKAQFHVPERYISRVELGQEITLTVAAYPNQEFTGKVYFIDPQIDTASRTALVKARVPNPDGILKAGMFATLDLIVEIKDQAVVVPETALIISGDTVSVFVIAKDNTVSMKVVEPGIRFDGMVEITSGIQGGDIVVTEGYQKIREGAQVNPRFEEAQDQ